MLGHRLNSNTKRQYEQLRNSALLVAAEALNRNHTGVEEMPAKRGPQREATYVLRRKQS